MSTTSFWSRLRKARVPELLGVYAGGSFAVLQVGDIFIQRLGLPDWTFFGLVVLLIVGLPATVVTALVQSSERTQPLGSLATWKNTTLLGIGASLVLALAVGGFMAARVLGIGPVGTLVAAGVLDREEAILIADFQAPTGDDLLVGAVTEAFRIDFEQSPMVRVVSPGAVREGLIRMQRPPDSSLTPELARELALREGIKAILMGEINQAGASSIISIRLMAADTEEALVSFRETVSDSAGVIPAVDRLSNRMRERIGESLRSIRSGEPLEQVSTSSLLALRRYSQALQAIDRERDFDAGIALLEEAIAEDSTFAMAWRKLGVTHLNENRPREQWEVPLTRAYELSDRLTERERYLTRANYHSAVLDDVDGAMRAYRNILDTYPNDQTALNNLATLHARRGEREEAARLFRRALELDSTTVIYYTNLLNQEAALGEFEAAEGTLAGLRSRFPDLAVSEIQAANFALVRQEYDAVEASLQRVLEHPRANPGERINALWGLAGVTALRGRLVESEGYIDQLRDLQEREGMGTGPGIGFQFRVLLDLTVRGDTARAVQNMEDFLAENPIPDEAYVEGAHLQAAALLAQAGEVERAQEYLRDWERIVEGETLAEFLVETEESLRALIALQTGDLEGALGHHRRKAADPRPIPEELFAVGEIHRRLGNPDSTIVYFERSLEASSPDQGFYVSFLRAQVLEQLGQLWEEVGDPVRAREYHQRFADLWADADAELQPRVRAAREGINAS